MWWREDGLSFGDKPTKIKYTEATGHVHDMDFVLEPIIVDVAEEVLEDEGLI